MGGVGDSAPPSVSADDKDFADEIIDDVIRRRLADDPLTAMKPRPAIPQSGYGEVTKFIDCVEYEVHCPDRDQSEEESKYVRICALAKLLRGQLQSGAMIQCAIDGSFAIFALGGVARAHAGGIYARMQAAWEKVDGANPISHAMKYGRKRNMDCASGFFFSLHDKDAERGRGQICIALIQSRASAEASGMVVASQWEQYRRSAIDGEEKYGPSWGVSFSINPDWCAIDGLSAARFGIEAARHLFARASSSAHFRQTYELPKEEVSRLFLLDVALKFIPDGSLVGDRDICRPVPVDTTSSSTSTSLSTQRLMRNEKDASGKLLTSLSATWHGDSGCHRAEMLAHTIAFSGRDVGRFFTPRHGRLRKGDARPIVLQLLRSRVAQREREYERDTTLRVDMRQEGHRS